jgi:hypothetical protein
VKNDQKSEGKKSHSEGLENGRRRKEGGDEGR